MYSYQDEIAQQQHQSTPPPPPPQDQAIELSVEETIHIKQIGLKSTKRKLLQAIVDSYNLEHRIKSKSGELQKKRMTNNQMRAHEQTISSARATRDQKERSIQNYISKVKIIDNEIKELQRTK